MMLAIAAIAFGSLAGCGTRRSTAELNAALRPAANAAAPVTAPSSAAADTQPANSAGSQAPTVTTTSGRTSTSDSGSSVGSDTSTSTNQAPTANSTTAVANHQQTSHHSSSGSTQVSLSQTVPGVESNCPATLAPITIGSVGEQSGLAGAAVAAGAQTVAAWAAYVNSLGGLRCHPIKFITADDGGDPSRNEALTQQLVDEDHVVAFVYNDGPLGSAGSEPYLVEHNLPVIGTGGLEQFFMEHPNFFPETAVGLGAVVGGMVGIVAQLNHEQRQHLGLITCIEASECTAAGKGTPKYAHRLGVRIVYNGTASLTAPDYTSQCLAAKRAGVQVLSLVLDPSSIHRAAEDCRNAGYAGLYATSSSVITSDDTSDPNLNHMVFGSPVKPWVTNSNPQIALMNQVLRTYAPGVSPVGSPPMGWTSAQLFAASSVFWPATDTITSADIIAGMDRLKNYDAGGLTVPLSFSRGHDASVSLCGFAMAIDNGKFVSPDNGARICM